MCNISKRVPFLFMIIVLLTTCEKIYTYLSIYTNGIACTVIKDNACVNSICYGWRPSCVVQHKKTRPRVLGVGPVRAFLGEDLSGRGRACESPGTQKSNNSS